jgi:surface polysaccharide O-acyltransferase-like enzyme
MNKRHIGLDLLRIVAMLMIISLHFMDFNNLLGDLEKISDYLAWLIESICYCGVNCYVLISGYFLCRSNSFQIKKCIDLYAVLWFYQVTISCGLLLFGVHYTIKDYVFTFFPFVTKRNWFFNTYLVLYMLHPFINKVIQGINEKQFRILLAILFFFFSVEETFLPKQNWMLNTHKGYDIIWFIILYLFAAYYRLYLSDKKIEKKWLFILFMLTSIIPFTLKLLCYNVDMLNAFQEKWYAYNSVPVFCSAFLFFVFFEKIKVENVKIKKIIQNLGRTTYGVFLIHTHFKLIPNYPSVVVVNLIRKYGFLPVYSVVVLTVFLLCVIIESLRLYVKSVIMNGLKSLRLDKKF